MKRPYKLTRVYAVGDAWPTTQKVTLSTHASLGSAIEAAKRLNERVPDDELTTIEKDGTVLRSLNPHGPVERWAE